MNLNHGKGGKNYIVETIISGTRAMKRIVDMGVIPGEKIKIIRNISFFGPILIEVKGSKLMLGRGIAQKIIIKEVLI